MTCSVRSPRKHLIALALVMSAIAAGWLLSSARAQPPVCELVEQVVVTAQGNPFGADDQAALADAIAAALNQAITQVRGVYVSVSTELFERFRTDLQGQLDFETDFSEQISNRFGGFVVRYVVEGERMLGAGWVEVTVRVDVCQDLRIALDVRGDSVVRQGLLSTLVRDVRAAGWQVVQELPGAVASGSERDMVAFTFDAGVTYVADATLITGLGSYGSFRNATATLDVVLIDSRTMQVAHSFSYTVTEAGNTDAQALQRAGQRLGEELARAWNQVFLRPEARQYATFIFDNVNRAGTRFTLEDIVAQIETVLGVTNVTYDSRYREVRMDVEVAGDPCAVARLVPTYRRVYTTLERCTGPHAVFRVTGD